MPGRVTSGTTCSLDPIVSIAPRPLLAAVGTVGVGALALAAFLQHARGFEPCPWCVFQRLLLMLVVVAAWLGAAIPPRWSRARVGTGFVALVLSLAGLFVALYQHVVAAQSASCALTLADRIIGGLGLAELWPAMFEATARCDEADLPWLGLPFSLWGATTFALTATGSALALLRRSWHA